MINKQVLLVLIATSLAAAIGRTFDVKAANGKLSTETVTFLGVGLTFLVVGGYLMFTKRKTIISEISNSSGPEIKYLCISALLFAPTFLAIYWLYTKEKPHILALFTTGLLITMNLLAGVVILKEKIATTTWAGAAIVFFGLALINYYHGKNSLN